MASFGWQSNKSYFFYFTQNPVLVFLFCTSGQSFSKISSFCFLSLLIFFCQATMLPSSQMFLISTPCDPLSTYWTLKKNFKLTCHSDFHSYVSPSFFFFVDFLINFCLLHLYHTFSIIWGRDKLSNCLPSFGPCSKCWPRKKRKNSPFSFLSFPWSLKGSVFSLICSHKDMPGIIK